jgi:hypothetical protein
MFDINREIELLERCALKCELISGLATDQRARYEMKSSDRNTGT